MMKTLKTSAKNTQHSNAQMKIAIIRLSSFGDIISSVVFLDLLRKNVPNVHITWIVDSAFSALLAHCKHIDCICDIPLRASKKNKKLIFDIIKKIRNLDSFDVVLDLQGLLKSALIGKMLQTKSFIGYASIGAREKIASIFYTKKVSIPYSAHILTRQYEILKIAFDWEEEFRLDMLDSRKNILRYSKHSQTAMQNRIKSIANCTKILFVIEASKKEKEYGIENFYKLAMEIKHRADAHKDSPKDSTDVSNLATSLTYTNFKDSKIHNALKIFLIWDKNEVEIRTLGSKDSIFYVLPHLNLDEIKALIAQMDLVIGGDTGITHLAWALKVPSITLYGNTPIDRFKLEGAHYVSMCKIAQQNIVKGDFSIQQIPPIDVANNAIKLLNTQGSQNA